VVATVRVAVMVAVAMMRAGAMMSQWEIVMKGGWQQINASIC